MLSFKVSHKDERGYFVVCAPGIKPKINMAIYDKAGNKAGKVIDVIGRIAKPYLVIQSEKEIKEVYLK